MEVREYEKLIKILLILATLLVLYLIYNHFTYEFSHLGDTKDGSPVLTPNKEYSAQIYYENCGGDAKGNFDINWLNSNTLSIINYNEYKNRSVKLLVEKQIYDEDGGACSGYKIKKNLSV